MVFIWPGSLLGLIAVGAVAVWSLFRPSRQLVLVGSLSLWQEAVANLDRSARRVRRVSASWALLLTGAAAAILALARPVWQSGGRARHVAIAVYPSAELAGPAGETHLAGAAAALLDRLDERDRVRVVRPTLLGGAGDWTSPAEARKAISALEVLPVAAAELALPEPGPEAQLAVHLAAAGAGLREGARSRVIELPTDLPAVTVDALGAVPRPGGVVQCFLAVRSHGQAAWQGELSIEALRRAGTTDEWRRLAVGGVSIAPGGTARIVRELPAADALAVRVAGREGVGSAAYLVRLSAVRRKVALVGADEPLLRRFVRADAALEPVADATEADLVIANGVRSPAGKPALEIDPPVDPPGCRRGAALAAVVLSGADVAAADPVMRHVALESVAVRRLRPWVRTAAGGLKVLAAHKGDAILARSDDSGPSAGPRRVYVAFELSGDNTNLPMTDAFVIFLANAVRWLAPPGRAEPTYACAIPARSGPAAAWRRVPEPGAPAPRRGAPGPLPWPGLFRDETGALRAVSLVGLRAGRPGAAPAEAVARLELPEPQSLQSPVELWPVLAVAAVALWLAGWWLRLR